MTTGEIIEAYDELAKRVQAQGARLAELETRAAQLEQKLAHNGLPESAPDECKQQTCTYYAHYLVNYNQGSNGPRLEHAAYHFAEQECDRAQRRVTDWYDAHRDDGRLIGTRLHGTRTTYWLDVESVYCTAVRAIVEAEKKAKKRGQR